MNARVHLVGMCLLLVLFGFCVPATAQDNPLIQAGDSFPDIALPVPQSQEDRTYLGIREGESFTLDQVAADVVLVELLNVYCYSCQEQAPVFNDLFDLLTADPKIRGRIKMMGIAAGNDDEEIADFRKEFKVLYPVVPDPEFEIYHALGGTRTPYTMLVRLQSAPDKPLVAATHLGVDEEAKSVLEELTAIAEGKAVKAAAAEKPAPAAKEEVKPLLPPAELEVRVSAAIGEVVGHSVEVEKVPLSINRLVYTAQVGQAGQSRRLFAEVVARLVPCDVCHAVHFIYVFDHLGRILGLTPLQMTKYGNEPFDQVDVARLRERIIGRGLGARLSFDPKVDAVAQATITSAVIFDSLSNGSALLEALKEKGLL